MNKLIKKYKELPQVTHASIAYVFCVCLQKGIQVITWPVFTRLLSLEQYGQYTLYVAWEEIASIFLTLNLATGMFPKAMEIFSNKREKYIATCQTIGVLLSIIFSVVLLLFYKSLEKVLSLPAILLFIMVINVCTYLPIQLWESRCRFENRYKSVVMVTALYTIISPILSLIFVLNNDNKGVAMIIGMVVLPIIMGVFFLVYNYITSKAFIDKELFIFAFRSHLPLVAFFLSSTVLNQSDRIMINYYCGKDKSAMYGVSYSLAMMITLVTGALNNSFIPFLYENIKINNIKAIRKRSTYNFIIISFLILGIIIFAPEAIMLVGGKKYFQAIWIIPPVAGSVILIAVSQLFINVQIYLEEKKTIVVSSVMVMFLNIILNILFLPKYGYYAAGYTTLVSYFIYMIVNYIIYKKMIQKREISELYNMLDYVKICIIVEAFALLGIIAYYNFVIRLLLFCLIILVLYLINRRRPVISK